MFHTMAESRERGDCKGEESLGLHRGLQCEVSCSDGRSSGLGDLLELRLGDANCNLLHEVII